MSDRADGPTEPYSPQRRTALVLAGSGTAGAYHAGVVRALHEAGVKLDLVAGRGVGVVGALFVAIDGAHRLWDDKGLWRAPVVATLYGWRAAPRVIAAALAAALALVAVPIAAVALGLVVFPIDFVLKMAGAGGASGLVGAYLRAADAAFAPAALPTWLPRLVLLVLGIAGLVACGAGIAESRERGRGGWWWRGVRPPLSAKSAIDQCWRVLWDLVGGAAQVTQPSPEDLGRRYADLLAENIGQPGFCELVITAHDADAHRDLIFALVDESRRSGLIRRSTSEAADARRAEVLDLAGVDRDRLADAVAGALTVPLATEWQTLTFAPDSFWRGETHRLCDRPASLIRLLDELIDLGVEQLVLVSAAPQAAGPHALSDARLDCRGRLGEYMQSAEAAIVRDATTTTGGVRIFTIRPVHNPIGPFDFSGGYDDRSHRAQGLDELMNRGYADAYHQFVEPVVGASGERVGSVRSL
ncbi:MAG: hypothetical protein LAO77_16890 [Acidobacteriia bacterium]|nr:hypothetical protein [Terriglobia bacterium]